MNAEPYTQVRDVKSTAEGIVAKAMKGRDVQKQRSVYTITARLPIEVDGRPRYRIKSKTEKVERVVTEEQISHGLSVSGIKWPSH
jgi:hypothetical protein